MGGGSALIQCKGKKTNVPSGINTKRKQLECGNGYK